MKRLTLEWVRKAEADLRAARKLAVGGDRVHDQVCFLSQQSAEKYLKGLLVELGLPIPRIHNLIALLPLLTPHHPTLRSFRRGLDFLTRFAVDIRYPGDSATKRQAHAALRCADAVRTSARALLGLRTHVHRGKKSP
jgi:HEPN domain-containing protein